MSDWGKPYGTVRYRTPDGLIVRLYRHRQACRWFTADGQQVGPEQPNVAPAVAYALASGWSWSDLELLAEALDSIDPGAAS